MNVADSSAWLEFVNGGENGIHFRPIIEDTDSLIVPAIMVYEVFKLTLRTKGEKEAHKLAVAMRQSRIIDIDEALALSAAKLALQHRLAMADSLIYAAALAHGATLWTQDDDFSLIPDVRYFAKAKKG